MQHPEPTAGRQHSFQHGLDCLFHSSPFLFYRYAVSNHNQLFHAVQLFPFLFRNVPNQVSQHPGIKFFRSLQRRSNSVLLYYERIHPQLCNKGRLVQTLVRVKCFVPDAAKSRLPPSSRKIYKQLLLMESFCSQKTVNPLFRHRGIFQREDKQEQVECQWFFRE